MYCVADRAGRGAKAAGGGVGCATLTILLTLSVHYNVLVSYAYNCRVYRDNVVLIRAGRRRLIVIIAIYGFIVIGAGVNKRRRMRITVFSVPRVRDGFRRSRRRFPRQTLSGRAEATIKLFYDDPANSR